MSVLMSISSNPCWRGQISDDGKNIGGDNVGIDIVNAGSKNRARGDQEHARVRWQIGVTGDQRAVIGFEVGAVNPVLRLGIIGTEENGDDVWSEIVALLKRWIVPIRVVPLFESGHGADTKNWSAYNLVSEQKFEFAG